MNDGGPAFPQQLSVGQRERGGNEAFGNGGMTLRDWFAGQALAGCTANTVLMRGIVEQFGEAKTAEAVATLVYHHANAMLAEREKRQ